MSEPIFDPKRLERPALRHEWVSLTGGRVCVREMAFGDTLFVLEHSQRPAGGPEHLAIDVGSVQIWQIVVSCYDGPGPEARRIFEITDVPIIRALRSADCRKLMEAIERVNGLSEAEVNELADFTGAARDGSAAISSSGASRISTGSRES